MKAILIADDEADLREILELNISMEFENPLLFVSNGSEAISVLKEKKDEIGLIICDYSMPVANGAKVFNYNKENQNVPFILLTGNLLEDCKDIQKFHESNALNQVLNKPWDEEALFNTIKSALD